MRLKSRAAAMAAAIPVALLLTASLPAAATTFVFSTTLTSAGEPVATSTATGAAFVFFDDVSLTVDIAVTFAGLANSQPFAHIHCCTTTPLTGSAGVVLTFTNFTQATTGFYARSFTLAPAAFNSLLFGAGEGRAYVNIHTPGTYAGGEIRGFLPVTPVPEPGTWALLASGVGAIVLLARRRREGAAAA